jgi:hypothetical protein
LNFNDYWYGGFVIRGYRHNGIVGKYELWDQIFGKFIILWWNPLDALPLFIVAIRAKYGSNIKDIPKYLIILGTIPVILTLIGWIDQLETVIRGFYLFQWALFTGRITYHSFVIYAFLTSKHDESRRASTSRYLWIISSIFWVFGLLNVLIYDSILGKSTYENEYMHLLFFVLINFGATLLLINHVFYPEAVLFTHEQIGRALSLYGAIDLTGNRIKDYGLVKIKNYLETLPEELKKELSIS